jgi:hypothetical protein
VANEYLSVWQQPCLVMTAQRLKEEARQDGAPMIFLPLAVTLKDFHVLEIQVLHS